ncbi:MAG: cation transporter [Nitrospira sp.]|nr:cation transporter [Nitrospira sp.]
MNRLRIGFVCMALVTGCGSWVEAATERTVMLMLGGQYCDLYLGDVESALKKIAGVKAVDLKSMKRHAVVTLEGDKATTKQLAEAVNGVKGEGWHCSAQVMK